MEFDFKIEGLEELEQQFKRLASLPEDKADAIEHVYLGGAEIIAADMRRRAPKGPSHNLQKSIVAKKLSRRGRLPAPAIAAVDRLRAPHAHLIEYGTKGRKVKKKKIMYDKRTGKFYGKEVEAMPAKPFFRPAVDTKGDDAAEHVSKGLSGIIEEVAR